MFVLFINILFAGQQIRGEGGGAWVAAVVKARSRLLFLQEDILFLV